MPLKRPKGKALAEIVHGLTGHDFKDHLLLETALTHSSAVRATTNNERLEFVGDRVLGLVIAEMLFEAFPDAREGAIAPRFNALVDARTCAAVGADLGLAQLMRADSALKLRERGSGGNYLADAVEALIAAIYLDGGLEAARLFIHRYWSERSKGIVDKLLNPKSEVQEWLARRGADRPSYEIVERTGSDHEPVFTVGMSVSGFPATSGVGRSRRAAEEAAATAFLKREGVWSVADE